MAPTRFKEPFLVGFGQEEESFFDLNLFLAGNSGTGKTHFGGTLFNAPTHFYMVDKGGERTLKKLLKNTPDRELSVDILSKNTTSFSAIWKKIQQDEKDGFYEYLAEQNGIAVFDSLTALNQKAILEIGKLNKRSPQDIGKPNEQKKLFNISDWGQLLSWMRQFVRTVQDLPCATLTTAHLTYEKDEDGAVIGTYPSIQGQFKQLVGVDFDESYLVERRNDSQTFYLQERKKYSAKSRVFDEPIVKNITLQDISDAYLKNKALKKK